MRVLNNERFLILINFLRSPKDSFQFKKSNSSVKEHRKKVKNVLEQVPKALLDLQQWDQLSYEECLQAALQVEHLLPSSFRFTDIRTYSSDLDRHHIAHFQWTTPPGTSLTHADIKVDPTYSYKILTRYLNAHDDLISLPEQKIRQIEDIIEEHLEIIENRLSYK